MIIWKRIEVVITGLTRNQVDGNVSWVRIPPLPASRKPRRASRVRGFGFYKITEGQVRIKRTPRQYTGTRCPETVSKRSGKRQSRFSPWETAFENAAQKMHEQVEQIPYLRRKDNANTGMDRKDKVVNHHQEVPYRVLERQYSYDEAGQHAEDNGSENMIIHGDNLEALKAPAASVRGQGKVHLH